MIIQFHTHETAGNGVSCYLAALRGGADGLDLSMAPMSGGTCQPDIITMWHCLDGDPDFGFDFDIKKIKKAEDSFKNAMKKYFLPPEAMNVNHQIVWSPMPGGALTANTQMLRDNNMMDKYDDMIAEMYDCVRLGGFGTSVTPVSQFYAQQAIQNVMFGKFKKFAPGYAKMVLGYFGKTPVPPDPEIVKKASEFMASSDLNKAYSQPTTKTVLEMNDADPKKGGKVAKKMLEDAGLPVTDENIFIAVSCKEKGILFLKDPSKAPMGCRFVDGVQRPEPQYKDGVTVTIGGKATRRHRRRKAASTARKCRLRASSISPAEERCPKYWIRRRQEVRHRSPAQSRISVRRSEVSKGDEVLVMDS